MITVHPERVSPDLLAHVRLALAVGAGAARTLGQLGAAIGVDPPAGPEPPRPGQALAWIRDEATSEVVAFTPMPARAERRRHVRKYAAGELGTDKSFYFRGPADRLNLRARNLRTFTEIAEGVDDDTWEHHRRRHDYSRWFRDAIKDDELAAEVEAIENDAGVAPTASRDRIRAAIDRRYTAPA
jgi:hypothetical protein